MKCKKIGRKQNDWEEKESLGFVLKVRSTSKNPIYTKLNFFPVIYSKHNSSMVSNHQAGQPQFRKLNLLKRSHCLMSNKGYLKIIFSKDICGEYIIAF